MFLQDLTKLINANNESNAASKAQQSGGHLAVVSEQCLHGVQGLQAEAATIPCTVCLQACATPLGRTSTPIPGTSVCAPPSVQKHDCTLYSGLSATHDTPSLAACQYGTGVGVKILCAALPPTNSPVCVRDVCAVCCMVLPGIR